MYFGEILVVCLSELVHTINIFDVSGITLNKCFFVVHYILIGGLFESEYLCGAEMRVIDDLNKV